jgi:hypothetical protein
MAAIPRSRGERVKSTLCGHSLVRSDPEGMREKAVFG